MESELTIAAVQEFLKGHSFELQSTHDKVCFQILRRIHAKLLLGRKFEPIKVEDGVIVNGHHRYICQCLLDIKVEQIKWTKNPSSLIIPWKEVQVIEDEWETEEQIKRHNEP